MCLVLRPNHFSSICNPRCSSGVFLYQTGDRAILFALFLTILCMSRVVHFEIQADDINRAKAFYENVLGWKVDQMMSKENGGMDYWGLSTGEGVGINGGMYQRPAEPEDQYHLYDCTVQVENLDEAIEKVKANGGTITKEKGEIPGVGFFAGAKDTEGNRFGLMQPTGWQPK